jgi:hypothetical protein
MTISSRLIFACVVLVLFVGAEWALFVKARNAGRHEVQALWNTQVKAAGLQVLVTLQIFEFWSAIATNSVKIIKKEISFISLKDCVIACPKLFTKNNSSPILALGCQFVRNYYNLLTNGVTS